MPKNIEDIIVPEKNSKRSIRNIPIPEGRSKIEREPRETSRVTINRVKETEELPRMKAPARRVDTDFIFKQKRNFPKKTILISATIGVVILGVALLSIFKSATVSYSPKVINLTFNKDSYVAYKAGTESDLMFSVVKLSGTKGVVAPASGEENVSVKASGKVIVYNNSGAAPFKLIHNTRFQTADGKIFRILADITIPGKKGDTPGSIEANLYADQAGPDYNIPLTDFTLPGLKGDPKYSTIYARSKTPMTGGFVGVMKKVSDADLAKAKQTLEDSLKTELTNQAKAQVPADFILYPGLVVVTYNDLPQTNPKSDSVTVNESADFYGVMFKRADLNNYLASKKAGQGVTGKVNIQNLEGLQANLQKPSGTDFLKADQIGFELTGNAQAVSDISAESLKKDLSGRQKDELNTVLSKYPDIESADVVIRPFWKSTFPSNPNNIKIVEKLPK